MRVQAPKVRVLARSDHLIALHKPSGHPTEPTHDPKRPTLYHSALSALGEGAYLRVSHRLDLGTSGVVVMAVSEEGTRLLAHAFERREARKLYWALTACPPQGASLEEAERFERDEALLAWAVERSLTPPRGAEGAEQGVWRHLSAPMRPIKRKKDAPRPKKQLWEITRSGGKPAKSDFKVIALSPSLCLVAARPHTGRTHQLRVHLAALNAPILGDLDYNPRAHLPRALTQRLWLHARALELPSTLSAEGDAPLLITAPFEL